MASWSGFHPLALTAWGSDIYGMAEQPARQRCATRRALAAADAITCDSADMRARLLSLGACADRVSIVQFGVDTDVFRPGLDVSSLRAALAIAPEARVVLSSRSVRPLYNIETIVRAVAAVRGVTLVLKDYQGDEDYRREVRGLIEELCIGDRVVWAGTVAHEELAVFYGLADVVVSVAATDSSPVSVLEAMACGTPVVASDIPGVREWISDGVNGFLASPDDPEQVASKLHAALRLGAATRARWARDNRAMVTEKADFAANMSLVGEWYERLLASGRRSPGLAT
jgi:glycosyltransferase involved in cell wall biosynthesis